MERAPSTTSLSHRSHYCAPRGPVLAGVPGSDGCRLSQGCFGRNAGAPIAPPCNAMVVAIDHAHPRRRSGPLGSRTLGPPKPVRAHFTARRTQALRQHRHLLETTP